MQLDASNRIVLPRDLRRAAGVPRGQKLRASATPGRIVLELEPATHGKVVQRGKLKLWTGDVPSIPLAEAVEPVRHRERGPEAQGWRFNRSKRRERRLAASARRQWSIFAIGHASFCHPSFCHLPSALHQHEVLFRVFRVIRGSSVLPSRFSVRPRALRGLDAGPLWRVRLVLAWQHARLRF